MIAIQADDWFIQFGRTIVDICVFSEAQQRSGPAIGSGWTTVQNGAERYFRERSRVEKAQRWRSALGTAAHVSSPQAT